MKRSTLRTLTTAALIAGAAQLALTPALTLSPAFRHRTVATDPALRSNELGPGVALLMGGSGSPIPPSNLVQWAFDHYLAPQGYGDYTTQVVFTPEGLSPIFSGIKSLPLDTSVAQGVSIINSAIKQQLEAGNNAVVGGVSQSSTIDALEMRDIANGSLGFQPTADQLAFMMVGDPSNPNGGLLSRFDLPVGTHPSIPSLDITFSGAAPADTGIPAQIYSLEYDGFADFPRYTLNLISDLNAFAGILIVHGDYIGGVTQDQIDNAIELPTSAGYDGGTTYYMMPYDGQLPLAALIEHIAGKPLADLLEPDLRVLANLGYGPDPYIGWSQSPADLPTPIGVFPSIDSDQFQTILTALSDGAQQGFTDFLTDLTNPASWLPTAASDPPSFTDIVNSLTSALAQAYAMLLPAADLITALTTTLPLNDATIFLDYLQAGDLIDAIGVPLAANVGLTTMAAGIEAMVFLETWPHIQAALDLS